MDDWTQRGMRGAATSLRHAWTLLGIGCVIALVSELATRGLGRDALSATARVGISTVYVAFLELGIVLVIFGRMLHRAASAGLLSDLRKRTRLLVPGTGRLGLAGLLLFVEVLVLTGVAWVVYTWGMNGLNLDDWPFTPALPFLMVADMTSFVALLVACGMVFVGTARKLGRG
jgi:hypothetical protein